MTRLVSRCVLLCLVAGAVLGHPARAEETMERLTVHRDVPYAAHARGLLDLYVPDGAEGAPVVLFVHGGALLFGDKSLAAHVGLRLAREGVITVAVNHRFSPAVSHPEHVRDLAAATRWVVEHIVEHGGDPERIVLAGHSSGGYLAALLAVDPRWLAEVEVDGSRIAGLVSISGFHYVDRLAPSRPKHVWGEDPTAWVDASPAHRATEAAPPALLLWADGDAEDRRMDGRDFAAVLAELGVATRKREIPDRDHRSIFFLLGSAGDPATDAIVDFLDEVVPRG